MPIISLQGRALTPLVLFRAKRIQKDIYSHSIRKDKDVFVATAEKGYVTANVFSLFMRLIFLPQLKKRRELSSLAKKPAVLFVDNHSAHVNKETLLLLAQHNVRVVTFIPHSSHKCQMLDLLPFSILKNKLREVELEGKRRSQKQILADAIPALEEATGRSHCEKAFRRAGIVMKEGKTYDEAELDEARLDEIQKELVEEEKQGEDVHVADEKLDLESRFGSLNETSCCSFV
jgi:hypothetical protein